MLAYRPLILSNFTIFALVLRLQCQIKFGTSLRTRHIGLFKTLKHNNTSGTENIFGEILQHLFKHGIQVYLKFDTMLIL